MKKVANFVFSTLVWLMLPFFLSANDTKGFFDAKAKVGLSTNLQCALPAPSGLTVLSTTPNTVKIQWTPVAGAVDYHVVAEVNGVPLMSISTFSNVASIFGLSPGSEVDIWVSAMCGPDDVSVNSSYIKARTDFVIEIVYEGIQSCDNTSFLTRITNGGGSLSIQNDIPYKAEFRLTANPEQKLVFGFMASSSFNQQSVQFVTHANNIPFMQLSPMNANFQCTNQQSNIPELFVTKCNNAMYYGKITIKSDVFGFKIFRMDELHPDYELVIYRCGNDTKSALRSNIADRSESYIPEPEAKITASPNPFKQTLRVECPMPNNSEEEQTLQLFDCTGKLWLDRKFNAPNGMIELDTHDLPNGMYFLNVRSGEHFQTIKLIRQNE
jgi:hypothetical protein